MLEKIKQSIYSLLRKSEKYTGTDMVYLAKGGFWLSGSKFIAALSAFVLAIAYANLLSKDDYGFYKYIISTVSILSIFALPGINTSITRSVSLGYEGLIKKAIKTKFIWSLSGALVGFFISGYYILQDNYLLAAGFFIASLFIPLIDGLIIHGNFLQGRKLFKQFTLFNSTSQILITICIISTLFIHANVLLLISVLYFSSFVIRGLFSLYIFNKYKPNQNEDTNMISYGKKLSYMSFLEPLSNNIDKIILWHFLGPVQVAIYAFSILPIKQFKTFIDPVIQLAFPKLTTQDISIIKNTLISKIIKFSLILLIPALLYFLLSNEIFKIIFPQYLDSVFYSNIYVVSLILYPFNMIATTFTAQAKTKQLYIIKISVPIIRILLMISLIPFFGIMGAVTALLLAQSFSIIISLTLFKKL